MSASLTVGVISKVVLTACLFILLFLIHHNFDSDKHVSCYPVVVAKETTVEYVHLAKNGTTNLSSDVIAILTRGENYTVLGERVGKLDTSLHDNLTAHVIIFHGGYPDPTELWEMYRHTKRRVFFQNVDKYFSNFPRGFDPYSNQPNWSIRTKWNYHHMINFWFKIVFELPAIQRYDYMMRLDFDSQLQGDWTNVFDLMREKKAVYMANFETLDFEWRLQGTLKLKTLVEEFINSTKLIVQDQNNFERAFNNESARTYWNNFEITDLRFFRQQNITSWVKTVVESHGIYKYRWGDAILRFLTLAVFAREDQILHREKLGLGYCHPC
jgi:hypothetical protein